MLTRNLFKASLLAATMAACLPAMATEFYVVVPVPKRTATPGNLTVNLSPYSPPAAMVGEPYAGFDFNQVLQVQGDPAFNSAQVRWTVATGALPAGLTLGANGLLSGTPTAAGTATFELQATYRTKAGVQTYRVTVTNLQVSLDTATLPDATQGVAYSFDLKPRLTISGDAAYTGAGVSWSLASGSLPAGLTLGTDGVITGMPSVEGTYPFTVNAAYKTKSGTQAYQVVVGAITVGLQPASLPEGIVGIAYNNGSGFDLKPGLSVTGDGAYAAGGAGVTWTVASGTLPAGLTLNASTGLITGTPDTSSVGATVQVKAAYKGKSATQSYTVAISGSIKQFSLVRMGLDETTYWLEVRDDGVGMPAVRKTRSIGLRSLSERAEIYGGLVSIQTRPDVDGTLVRMELPERRMTTPAIGVRQ